MDENYFAELVETISRLLREADTIEGYDVVWDLCDELDEDYFAEAEYWRARTCLYRAYSKREQANDYSIEMTDEDRNLLNADADHDLELAIKHIADCLASYDKDQEMEIGYACLEKARILKAQGKIHSAREMVINLMMWDDSDVVSGATDLYEELTKILIGNFNYFFERLSEELKYYEDPAYSEEDAEELKQLAIECAESSRFCDSESFQDRQFIFFVKSVKNIAGCVDSEDNIKWVFTLDQRPKDLVFPVGHPQANTLYVANPVKKGEYLPFEGAEDKLFHEKVNEFIYLSQCLGATEITFHSVRGEDVSESSFGSQRGSANLSYAKIGGSAAGSGTNRFDGTYKSARSTELTRIYDPIKTPYCPDDLIWLEHDSEWQRFVKQRLEGNILESTMRISSSEIICATSNKTRSLQASFENLMTSADASYDSSEDVTFSSNTSTEWEISVKFRSLRDFEESASPILDRLTEEEESFKEEVMFALEDGGIDDSVRKFLERKRVKLGISEERARAIEESCKPSLSAEELEYIELFKEIAGDGEVSDRMRRMLTREADSLGISDSRALELESMARD